MTHLVTLTYVATRSRLRRAVFILKFLWSFYEPQYKFRRRRSKLRKDRALYQAWTSGTSSPVFQLECPDINLVQPLIERLGPGGIPMTSALYIVRFHVCPVVYFDHRDLQNLDKYA